MVFLPFLHMPTLTLPCAMDGVMFMFMLYVYVLWWLLYFLLSLLKLFLSKVTDRPNIWALIIYWIRSCAQQLVSSRFPGADFTGRQQMCFQLLRWSCCWGTNTLNISSVCWYFPSSSSWVHKPASKWVRPSNTWALEYPDTKAIVGRYQILLEYRKHSIESNFDSPWRDKACGRGPRTRNK